MWGTRTMPFFPQIGIDSLKFLREAGIQHMQIYHMFLTYENLDGLIAVFQQITCFTNKCIL